MQVQGNATHLHLRPDMQQIMELADLLSLTDHLELL